KRIAYVGPAHSSNQIDRHNGYREALAAAGIAENPALHVTLAKDFLERASYERTVEQWLALPEPPDAIIVPDDDWATWVIGAIESRGLGVPEDIAGTGYNDLPEAARAAGGLTTIRQPFRQMGQTAAERLLALIEGAPVSECRVTLPTELVVRGSTVA